MNLGDMQTLVYRYGFSASDPVTSILNAAMHEFESMFDWPFLEEGPYNFAVGAGVSTLTLPADFFKPIMLRDVDHAFKLVYWDRRKFARDIYNYTDTGWPEIYTAVGQNAITIWRVPVSPVNMELVYQATTPDLVNPSDVPTTGTQAWPTLTHMPIVFRAAAIMLQMENEEDRAKTAQEQYESGLTACMRKFGERELDEPTTVEDAQGYSGSTLPLRGIAGW